MTDVNVLLLNAAGMVLVYWVIFPRFLPTTVGKTILMDAILSILMAGFSLVYFWESRAWFLLLGWYWGLRGALWSRT